MAMTAQPPFRIVIRSTSKKTNEPTYSSSSNTLEPTKWANMAIAIPTTAQPFTLAPDEGDPRKLESLRDKLETCPAAHPLNSLFGKVKTTNLNDDGANLARFCLSRNSFWREDNNG